MSKLKKFAFYVVVIILSCLASRAVFAWRHLVSNPMDTLYGSLIAGLVGGILLMILTNLPIGRRNKK